jgi:hypothetical protein
VTTGCGAQVSELLRDDPLQPDSCRRAGTHRGTGPSTSFSISAAAVLGVERPRAGCMQRLSCSPSSMLVQKDPETAPLCPQCEDAMRLARKLPPVRPLSGLVVHLCGRCRYVGTADREPEPPPPKWLRPQRGTRYFVPAPPIPMISRPPGMMAAKVQSQSKKSTAGSQSGERD